MKIIIECSPEIDRPEERMFEWLKGTLAPILREGLNEFTLEIEGTTLKYSQLNEGIDNPASAGSHSHKTK